MTDHAELIAAWRAIVGTHKNALSVGIRELCDALAALAKEHAELQLRFGVWKVAAEQAERERDIEKARADAYQIEHGKVLGLWQACEKERDEALRLLAQREIIDSRARCTRCGEQLPADFDASGCRDIHCPRK